jgi:hypothetical protein
MLTRDQVLNSLITSACHASDFINYLLAKFVNQVVETRERVGPPSPTLRPLIFYFFFLYINWTQMEEYHGKN